MKNILNELPLTDTKLMPQKTYFLQTTYQAAGNVSHRMSLIRDYMLSLSTDNLVRNYLLEAGLWNENGLPKDIHWGWESPTSQLRGHFLGHWLSGAAQIYAQTGDTELKGKADAIVEQLRLCQERNGGEWVFSIPEKYLELIGRGEIIWAPQYTIHKTLMGLWDMFEYARNEQALSILLAAAEWFIRWISKYSDEQFTDILDFETGGMLEIWANLYGHTREQRHLDLLNRYWRHRVFDPILEGEDVLTNYHANTTIPEIIGAARAYEVTGEEKWRKVSEAYWDSAVTSRGFYSTGGQTNGEAWSPPNKLAARLGQHNQEHCTVYNMMRLASILYRWTGDIKFSDYWERNFYNGILAQENPVNGMVSYYLGMEAGSKKKWGSRTDDFWCCHGSLVQVPAMITPNIYHFEGEGIIRISQFLPSEASFLVNETEVTITQAYTVTPQPNSRPTNIEMRISVTCDKPESFTLKLRIPQWVKETPSISVNDDVIEPHVSEGLIVINRNWSNESIDLIFEKELKVVPLPDEENMVSFMDGPVVLAGLCDEEIALSVEGEPQRILVPHDEYSCECWRGGYKTTGQKKNIKFVPLHTIVDEHYTLYFPLAPTDNS